MSDKKNPWFRMYSDFMFDEKIEFLAFEDQRHYVFILCMKNAGLLDKEYAQPGMLDRVIAKRLGLFGEAFEAAKRRLVESGLIAGDFQPVAWNKRQFLSDSSAERTRAYRERMAKKVADPDMANEERHSDVTVTAQEADTETDTDTEEAKASLSPAKLPTCPHEILIDLFGKHLPTMPQPKKELWSGKNESAMRARWKWVMTAVKKNGTRYAATREEAIDWFERFFAYIQKSDFLTGRAGGWDKCDLGWLVKADNFAKVLQGNYENKDAS